MGTKERLQPNQEKIIGKADFVSKASLFERTAKLKNLELGQNDDSFCFSKPLAQLPLNRDLRKGLIDHGFLIDDTRTDKILTIYLPPKVYGGSSSEEGGYWNINKRENPIFVLPQISFSISEKKRSILLKPHVTFTDVGIGTINQNTHNRIAQVIDSCYPKVSPILKEVIHNDFKLIVPWKEIDAAGIRKLFELFSEWSGDNEGIKHLCNSNISPFRPSPYSYDDEKIISQYLPELFQGNLFTQWEKQLEEFKRNLR